MRSTLQLLVFIFIICLGVNFVTTLEWDHYYNVIDREVFIAKAVLFIASCAYLLYLTYEK